VSRITSQRYLDASRGQTCKFQIPGICQGGTDTTVPCHIRDDHTGGAQKASDISVADGCFSCHNVMDRRAKMDDGTYITETDWLFYSLRALQRTLEGRIEAKVLVIVGDRPKATHRSRIVRKPKEERTPIQSKPNWPPKGSRKIQQRAPK